MPSTLAFDVSPASEAPPFSSPDDGTQHSLQLTTLHHGRTRHTYQELPYLALALPITGQAHISGSFGRLRLRANSVVVIAPMTRFTFEGEPGQQTTLTLINQDFAVQTWNWVQPHRVSPAELKRKLHQKHPPFWAAELPEATYTDLSRTIQSLGSTQTQQNSWQEMTLCMKVLWHIDRLIAPSLKAAPTKHSLRMEVARARGIIEAEYAQPLQIAEIADRVGVSGSTLTRLFRGEMGMTPREYLSAVRMEHFEQLAIDSRMSAERAAHAVGLSSTRYLRSAIQQKYGISLRDVRKRTGSTQPTSSASQALSTERL